MLHNPVDPRYPLFEDALTRRTFSNLTSPVFGTLTKARSVTGVRDSLLVLMWLALLSSSPACSSGRDGSSKRHHSGKRAVLDASVSRTGKATVRDILPVRKALPAGGEETVDFPAVRRSGPINPSACDSAADVIVLGRLESRNHRGDEWRLKVRRTVFGQAAGAPLRVHGGASFLPAKRTALMTNVFGLRLPLDRNQGSYEVLWAGRVESRRLMTSYAATLFDYHVLSSPSIFEGTAERLDPTKRRLVVRVTRVLKGPPLAEGSRVSLEPEDCMGLRGAAQRLRHQPPLLYFASLDEPAAEHRPGTRSGTLGIRLPVSYASHVSASMARRTSYPLYRCTDGFGCTTEKTWNREPVFLGDPATVLPALRSPLSALRTYAARSIVLHKKGPRLLESAIAALVLVPRERWAGEFRHLHQLVALLEQAERHHYTGALERLVDRVLDKLESATPPSPSPVPADRTELTALAIYDKLGTPTGVWSEIQHVDTNHGLSWLLRGLPPSRVAERFLVRLLRLRSRSLQKRWLQEIELGLAASTALAHQELKAAARQARRLQPFIADVSRCRPRSWKPYKPLWFSADQREVRREIDDGRACRWSVRGKWLGVVPAPRRAPLEGMLSPKVLMAQYPRFWSRYWFTDPLVVRTESNRKLLVAVSTVRCLELQRRLARPFSKTSSRVVVHDARTGRALLAFEPTRYNRDYEDASVSPNGRILAIVGQEYPLDKWFLRLYRLPARLRHRPRR